MGKIGSGAVNISWKKLLSLASFLFLFLPVNPYSASSEINPPLEPFPTQYGQVIFQSNEKSPNQVYIIGMSHRDTFTRTNGHHTSLAQAEVYRIADWLYHQKGVRLVLPEGFFRSKSVEVKEINNKIKTGLTVNKGCSELADFETLKERLADDHVFTNAEMLLKESHSVHLRQVEDWPIYDSVSKALLKVVQGGPACDISLLKELDYLQERRVGAMLQRIPEVVTDSFQHQDILEKKAIFTIGMMHIYHIIQYLTENRMFIQSPDIGSTKRDPYAADLKLASENFGITVIIPRSMAENPKILKINNLDRIVSQARKISLN